MAQTEPTAGSGQAHNAGQPPLAQAAAAVAGEARVVAELSVPVAQKAAAASGEAAAPAPLCGLWVDAATGVVHTCRASAEGGRVYNVQMGFRPFLWATAGITGAAEEFQAGLAQDAGAAAGQKPASASGASLKLASATDTGLKSASATGASLKPTQDSGDGAGSGCAVSSTAASVGSVGSTSSGVGSGGSPAAGISGGFALPAEGSAGGGSPAAGVGSGGSTGSGVGSAGVVVRHLHGSGWFNHLVDCADVATLEAFIKFVKAQTRPPLLEVLRPLEYQYLMRSGEFLFEGLRFDALRRCQLDIETRCADPAHNFPDARRSGDRVLAVGLRQGDRVELLELAADTDAAERELLERLNTLLGELDPDVIEGHNIFRFDLDYLRLRCKRLKVPMLWGRFGQEAAFRQSRLRIAERWIDFPRCDLAGRAVFDTYLAVQLYDVAGRELPSYSLKVIARHFGVTTEASNRTYVQGDAIAEVFDTDRERFRAYLRDDLRESAGVGAILLPTYAAQVKALPMTLQEAALRGTGGKVDLLLLARYLQAGEAIPEPTSVDGFEGALSKSLVEGGVYRHVLHFDVASLYPSLLLLIGRAPKGDSLGVFLPLLEQLRSYRLRYKKLARESADSALRQEYDARQNSFKVLINSFYGYLGFSGARFADGDLAAEVTARGRALMETLIGAFEAEGCTVLEVDTDGLYIASETHYTDPEALLVRLERYLPQGIELEFDGAFPAMFCYKAKNYALYDGKRVHITGSALRSRGVEPFLKQMNEALIDWQLGVPAARPPAELLAQLEAAIRDQSLPVAELARSEYLSQSPQTYAKSLAQGKGMRRASLEVALTLEPQPAMGDRVTYYITQTAKRLPDWQRARALEQYDPVTAPYDPAYYVKKLEDWRTRYAEFLPATAPEQGELFG